MSSKGSSTDRAVFLVLYGIPCFLAIWPFDRVRDAPPALLLATTLMSLLAFSALVVLPDVWARRQQLAQRLRVEAARKGAVLRNSFEFQDRAIQAAYERYCMAGGSLLWDNLAVCGRMVADLISIVLVFGEDVAGNLWTTAGELAVFWLTMVVVRGAVVIALGQRWVRAVNSILVVLYVSYATVCGYCGSQLGLPSVATVLPNDLEMPPAFEGPLEGLKMLVPLLWPTATFMSMILFQYVIYPLVPARLDIFLGAVLLPMWPAMTIPSLVAKGYYSPPADALRLLVLHAGFAATMMISAIMLASFLWRRSEHSLVRGFLRSKRLVEAAGNRAPLPECKATGCTADLMADDEASGLFLRVCKEHRAAQVLHFQGGSGRFCVSCQEVHPLDKFEGRNNICESILEKEGAERESTEEGFTEENHEAEAKALELFGGDRDDSPEIDAKELLVEDDLGLWPPAPMFNFTIRMPGTVEDLPPDMLERFEAYAQGSIKSVEGWIRPGSVWLSTNFHLDDEEDPVRAEAEFRENYIRDLSAAVPWGRSKAIAFFPDTFLQVLKEGQEVSILERPVGPVVKGIVVAAYNYMSLKVARISQAPLSVLCRMSGQYAELDIVGQVQVDEGTCWLSVRVPDVGGLGFVEVMQTDSTGTPLLSHAWPVLMSESSSLAVELSGAIGFDLEPQSIPRLHALLKELADCLYPPEGEAVSAELIVLSALRFARLGLRKVLKEVLRACPVALPELLNAASAHPAGSLLAQAIRSQSVKMVELILETHKEEGVRPGVTVPHPRTGEAALHWAARIGKYRILARLLSHDPLAGGAWATLTAQSGMTPAGIVRLRKGGSRQPQELLPTYADKAVFLVLYGIPCFMATWPLDYAKDGPLALLLATTLMSLLAFSALVVLPDVWARRQQLAQRLRVEADGLGAVLGNNFEFQDRAIQQAYERFCMAGGSLLWDNLAVCNMMVVCLITAVLLYGEDVAGNLWTTAGELAVFWLTMVVVRGAVVMALGQRWVRVANSVLWVMYHIALPFSVYCGAQWGLPSLVSVLPNNLELPPVIQGPLDGLTVTGLFLWPSAMSIFTILLLYGFFPLVPARLHFSLGTSLLPFWLATTSSLMASGYYSPPAGALRLLVLHAGMAADLLVICIMLASYLWQRRERALVRDFLSSKLYRETVKLHAH